MVPNWLLCGIVVVVLISATADAQLSTTFYNQRCPKGVAKVAEVVKGAVAKDRTIAPALLRLHFHDCFVRVRFYSLMNFDVESERDNPSHLAELKTPLTGKGISAKSTTVKSVCNAPNYCTRYGCDASVLLDSTSGVSGEKDAFGNAKSLRGFEVIDSAKSQVEALCPGVVSCADILTLAARDAIQAFGGLNWTVPLGRRDGLSGSANEANNDLPPPSMNFDSLVSLFSRKGFSMKEMITLSGAHTLGVAHCSNVESRLYNFSKTTPTDPSIDATFAASLKKKCKFGDKVTTIRLDQSTTTDVWDFNYYSQVLRGKVLFSSDDAIKRNSQGLKHVQAYNKKGSPFNSDFAAVMTKLGNLGVLTGTNGQIRRRCNVKN